MTKMMFAFLAMTAIAGSAQAKCPAGTQTILSCKSTPQAGDQVVAGQIADTIELCTKGSKTLINLEAGGTGPGAIETEASVRMGATVYPISDLGNLSVGSRPYPNNVKMAKFYMNGGSQTISSTFTCVTK